MLLAPRNTDTLFFAQPAFIAHSTPKPCGNSVRLDLQLFGHKNIEGIKSSQCKNTEDMRAAGSDAIKEIGAFEVGPSQNRVNCQDGSTKGVAPSSNRSEEPLIPAISNAFPKKQDGEVGGASSKTPDKTIEHFESLSRVYFLKQLAQIFTSPDDLN